MPDEKPHATVRIKVDRVPSNAFKFSIPEKCRFALNVLVYYEQTAESVELEGTGLVQTGVSVSATIAFPPDVFAPETLQLFAEVARDELQTFIVENARKRN